MGTERLKPQAKAFNGSITYRLASAEMASTLVKCSQCREIFSIEYPAKWNRETLHQKATEELLPCERHPKAWGTHTFIDLKRVTEAEVMEFQRDGRRGRPKKTA